MDDEAQEARAIAPIQTPARFAAAGAPVPFQQFAAQLLQAPQHDAVGLQRMLKAKVRFHSFSFQFRLHL